MEGSRFSRREKREVYREEVFTDFPPKKWVQIMWVGSRDSEIRTLELCNYTYDLRHLLVDKRTTVAGHREVKQLPQCRLSVQWQRLAKR